MGTRIGTDGFSPSKVFETTLENKIDGNIYWGTLAQFAFISEQDCCFRLLQSNQVFHFEMYRFYLFFLSSSTILYVQDASHSCSLIPFPLGICLFNFIVDTIYGMCVFSSLFFMLSFLLFIFSILLLSYIPFG